MPRVALVYPYFRTRSRNEILFPPLGEAYLASQLHLLGIETRIFDCTFETLETIQTELKDYKPDIVGIYSMVTLSRNAFKIAKLVREEIPESLLVVGGPLPTLYPDQYSTEFDLVFRGEADLSFPKFCQDFFNLNLTKNELGKLSLDAYSGLYIKNPTICIDNPLGHSTESELASFPIAYRDDFDHAAYQDYWQQQDGTKTTSLMTTFGCPFNCDFCSRPVFGDYFRRNSLDKVFAEIEQIQALGYDSLWIADDNFTLDVSFLKEFCRRISGKKLQWSCLSRVTGINADLVKMMKEAGCHRAYLGLESGNHHTLEMMQKRATLEEGRQAVHLFHQAGIEVAAFFIVGYPGETTSSIEDTFRYAFELPIDIISFNVPFPLPGSPLYQRVSKLDPRKDWNVENEITFVYESEFEAGWLQRRIDETMQAFEEKKRISNS